MNYLKYRITEAMPPPPKSNSHSRNVFPFNRADERNLGFFKPLPSCTHTHTHTHHLNELRITPVFRRGTFLGRWDGNFQRCRWEPFRSVRRPFVLSLPPPTFVPPSRKGIRDSKIRGGEGFLVSEFGETRSRGKG